MLVFAIILLIYCVVAIAIYLFLVSRIWNREEVYYSLTIPISFAVTWPVAIPFAIYSLVTKD